MLYLSFSTPEPKYNPIIIKMRDVMKFTLPDISIEIAPIINMGPTKQPELNKNQNFVAEI